MNGEPLEVTINGKEGSVPLTLYFTADGKLAAEPDGPALTGKMLNAFMDSLKLNEIESDHGHMIITGVEANADTGVIRVNYQFTQTENYDGPLHNVNVDKKDLLTGETTTDHRDENAPNVDSFSLTLKNIGDDASADTGNIYVSIEDDAPEIGDTHIWADKDGVVFVDHAGLIHGEIHDLSTGADRIGSALEIRIGDKIISGELDESGNWVFADDDVSFMLYADGTFTARADALQPNSDGGYSFAFKLTDSDGDYVYSGAPSFAKDPTPTPDPKNPDPNAPKGQISSVVTDDSYVANAGGNKDKEGAEHKAEDAIAKDAFIVNLNGRDYTLNIEGKDGSNIELKFNAKGQLLDKNGDEIASKDVEAYLQKLGAITSANEYGKLEITGYEVNENNTQLTINYEFTQTKPLQSNELHNINEDVKDAEGNIVTDHRDEMAYNADSFTVTVTDDRNQSATGKINVSIEDDAPEMGSTKITNETTEDGSIIIEDGLIHGYLAGVSTGADRDGATLEVRIGNKIIEGTLDKDGNWNFGNSSFKIDEKGNFSIEAEEVDKDADNNYSLIFKLTDSDGDYVYSGAPSFAKDPTPTPDPKNPDPNAPKGQISSVVTDDSYVANAGGNKDKEGAEHKAEDAIAKDAFIVNLNGRDYTLNIEGKDGSNIELKFNAKGQLLDKNGDEIASEDVEAYLQKLGAITSTNGYGKLEITGYEVNDNSTQLKINYEFTQTKPLQNNELHNINEDVKAAEGNIVTDHRDEMAYNADSFTVTVTDDRNQSATGKINVSIEDDAPEMGSTKITNETTEDGSIIIEDGLIHGYLAGVSTGADRDGATLEVRIGNKIIEGTLDKDGNWNFGNSSFKIDEKGNFSIEAEEVDKDADNNYSLIFKLTDSDGDYVYSGAPSFAKDPTPTPDPKNPDPNAPKGQISSVVTDDSYVANAGGNKDKEGAEHKAEDAIAKDAFIVNLNGRDYTLNIEGKDGGNIELKFNAKGELLDESGKVVDSSSVGNYLHSLGAITSTNGYGELEITGYEVNDNSTQLKINYEFTQTKPLQSNELHNINEDVKDADGNIVTDHRDEMAYNVDGFRVTVTDDLNQSATGNINVSIEDDAPEMEKVTIINKTEEDGSIILAEDGLIYGQIVNFSTGADKDGAEIEVRIGDQIFTGQRNEEGKWVFGEDAKSFTLDDNGKFSASAKDFGQYTNSEGSYSFTFKLTDSDGDYVYSGAPSFIKDKDPTDPKKPFGGQISSELTDDSYVEGYNGNKLNSENESATAKTSNEFTVNLNGRDYTLNLKGQDGSNIELRFNARGELLGTDGSVLIPEDAQAYLEKLAEVTSSGGYGELKITGYEVNDNNTQLKVKYEFTQTKPYDHNIDPDLSPADQREELACNADNFTVTITDDLGQTVTGNINVSIEDDKPEYTPDSLLSQSGHIETGTSIPGMATSFITNVSGSQETKFAAAGFNISGEHYHFSHSYPFDPASNEWIAGGSIHSSTTAGYGISHIGKKGSEGTSETPFKITSSFVHYQYEEGSGQLQVKTVTDINNLLVNSAKSLYIGDNGLTVGSDYKYKTTDSASWNGGQTPGDINAGAAFSGASGTLDLYYAASGTSYNNYQKLLSDLGVKGSDLGVTSTSKGKLYQSNVSEAIIFDLNEIAYGIDFELGQIEADDRIMVTFILTPQNSNDDMIVAKQIFTGSELENDHLKHNLGEGFTKVIISSVPKGEYDVGDNGLSATKKSGSESDGGFTIKSVDFVKPSWIETGKVEATGADATEENPITYEWDWSDIDGKTVHVKGVEAGNYEISVDKNGKATFKIGNSIKTLFDATIDNSGDHSGEWKVQQYYEFEFRDANGKVDTSKNPFQITAIDADGSKTNIILNINAEFVRFDEMHKGFYDSTAWKTYAELDKATDILSGGTGNDLMYGKGGNDLLVGDGGKDAVEKIATLLSVDGETTSGMVSSTNNESGISVNAADGSFKTHNLSGTIINRTEAFKDLVDKIEADKSGTAEKLEKIEKANPEWAGDDAIYGGLDDDVLIGLGGNDFLHGNDGKDYIFAGGGNDIIMYDKADGYVHGGSGTDVLVVGSKDYESAKTNSNVQDIEIFLESTKYAQPDQTAINGHDSLGNIGMIVSDGLLILNQGEWNDATAAEDGSIKATSKAEDFNIHTNMKDVTVLSVDKNTFEQYQVNGIETSLAAYGIMIAEDNRLILDERWQQQPGSEGETNSTATFTTGAEGISLKLQISTDKVQTLIEHASVDNILQGDDLSNILKGGDGAEQLFGGLVDDELYGGEGDDYLDGEDGKDRLEAGAGNDIIVFDPEDFFIDGGEGVDFLLVGKDQQPGMLKEIINNEGKAGETTVKNVDVVIGGDTEAVSSIKGTSDLDKLGIIIGEDGKSISLDAEQWDIIPAGPDDPEETDEESSQPTYTYAHKTEGIWLETTIDFDDEGLDNHYKPMPIHSEEDTEAEEPASQIPGNGDLADSEEYADSSQVDQTLADAEEADPDAEISDSLEETDTQDEVSGTLDDAETSEPDESSSDVEDAVDNTGKESAGESSTDTTTADKDEADQQTSENVTDNDGKDAGEGSETDASKEEAAADKAGPDNKDDNKTEADKKDEEANDKNASDKADADSGQAGTDADSSTATASTCFQAPTNAGNSIMDVSSSMQSAGVDEATIQSTIIENGNI